MNSVVIGAQWGDEGKGKVVDFLSRKAELIIRFSGGANAGHTIVTESKEYKLRLIPSGIIYPETKVLLGTGMVIDPEALFDELEELKQAGVDWEGRVFISERAHLIFPLHKTLDKRKDRERRRPIGTTGRGIGEAYKMKSSREGVRMIDLCDRTFLFRELDGLSKQFLEPFRDWLQSMLCDPVTFHHRHQEKNILFEGAQGILLDLNIGTYPFVSSGISSAAGALIGGGIGPSKIDRVIGVFKAYSTRVGEGPFPTEFRGEATESLEKYVRKVGREYGVNTGRPRRCGYLDLPALRYACLSNSLSDLAMTHLDVYDKEKEIKVCTAYKVGGKIIKDFPSSLSALEEAEPVLESLPGWKKNLSRVQNFEDLPQEAKAYIHFIEDYTETPVTLISVGPAREETFFRKNLWVK